MNYVIKNYKNLYIRLNENGKPVTCSEKERGVFEYSKAKNILDNLQKTLKKLSFKVEAIPETIRRREEVWEMDCFSNAWNEWFATNHEYANSDKQYFETLIKPYTCFVGIYIKIK